MTNQRKEERPWWMEEFRKELKEQYKGILPDEILDKGNPWFEAFISRVERETLRRAAERVRGMKRPISGTGFKAEREIGIDTDTYDNGYNHGIDAAAKSLEASEKVDNQ